MIYPFVAVCGNDISVLSRMWRWYLRPQPYVALIPPSSAVCDNDISVLSRMWQWYLRPQPYVALMRERCGWLPPQCPLSRGQVARYASSDHPPHIIMIISPMVILYNGVITVRLATFYLFSEFSFYYTFIFSHCCFSCFPSCFVVHSTGIICLH